MKSKLFALAALAAVMTAGQAQAGTMIDTLSGWNGSDNIFFFGQPDTSTYGQTITVGSDNVLNSFTFLLDQTTVDPVNFQGYVMAWNDALSRATGPVLYSSSVQTTGGSSAGFETFMFNTGNLSLASGSMYVLFLNTSNNFDSFGDQARMASRNSGSVYSGGQFVYLNNGSNFNAVTTSSWTKNHNGTGSDTAFVAQFSAVPEPTSIALLATGGLGLAGGALRRRRARKAAV